MSLSLRDSLSGPAGPGKLDGVELAPQPATPPRPTAPSMESPDRSFFHPSSVSLGDLGDLSHLGAGPGGVPAGLDAGSVDTSGLVNMSIDSALEPDLPSLDEAKDRTAKAQLVDQILAQSQVLPLRREINRLVNANNALHAELIEQTEAFEAERADWRKKLTTMQGRLTDAQYLLAVSRKKTKDLELRNQKLQERLHQLMHQQAAFSKQSLEATYRLDDQPIRLPSAGPDDSKKGTATTANPGSAQQVEHLHRADMAVTRLRSTLGRLEAARSEWSEEKTVLEDRLARAEGEVSRLRGLVEQDRNWDRVHVGYYVEEKEKEIRKLLSHLDILNAERAKLAQQVAKTRTENESLQQSVLKARTSRQVRGVRSRPRPTTTGTKQQAAAAGPSGSSQPKAEGKGRRVSRGRRGPAKPPASPAVATTDDAQEQQLQQDTAAVENPAPLDPEVDDGEPESVDVVESVAHYDEQLRQCNEQIKSLTAQCNASGVLVEDLRAESRRYATLYRESMQQSADLKRVEQGLQSMTRALQQELDAVQGTVDELRAQKRDAQQAWEQASLETQRKTEEERAQWAEENAQLRIKVQRLEKDQISQQRDSITVSDDRNALSADLRAARESLATARQEVVELSAQLKQRDGALETAKASITQLSIRASGTDAALQELNETRTQLTVTQQEVARLRRAADDAIRRAQSLGSEKESLMQRVLLLSSQKAELRTQLSAFDSAITRVQDKIAALTRERDALKRQVGDLSESSQRADQGKESAQTAAQSLEVQLERSRDETRALQTDLVNAEQRYEALMQDLRAAREQIALTEQRLAGKVAVIEQSRKQLAESDALVKDWTCRHERVQAELKSVQKQYAEEKERREELRQRLLSLQSTINALESTTADADRRKSQADVEVQLLKQAVDEETARVAAAQAEVRRVTEQGREKQQELELALKQMRMQAAQVKAAENARAQWSEQERKMKRQIQQLEQAQRDFDARIGAVQETVVSKQAELDKNVEALSTTRAELRAARNDLATAGVREQMQKEELKGVMHDLESMIAENQFVNSELMRLQAEKGEVHEDVGQKEERIAVLEAACARKDQEREEVMKLYQSALGELETAKNGGLESETVLSQERSRRRAAEKEVLGKMRALEEERAKVEQWRLEAVSLRQKITEYAERVSRLETSVAQRDSQLQRTSSDLMASSLNAQQQVEIRNDLRETIAAMRKREIEMRGVLEVTKGNLRVSEEKLRTMTDKCRGLEVLLQEARSANVQRQ